MSKHQWFSVDKDGLGKQAQEHPKGRLVGELVQNSLDESGVTQIAVTLALVPGRPLADLTVEDDSPEGFKDLSHAYTLFAESYKRSNPQQRGQFNLGEKMVLAICESASIATTTGTVIFDSAEGRIEKPRQKRDRGSVFQGRIKMTRDEYTEVCDYVRSLLLPDKGEEQGTCLDWGRCCGGTGDGCWRLPVHVGQQGQGSSQGRIERS